MTQESQADHWPNIVHPSSPNPELTHCYLLHMGILLKVLFGEPGEIIKKKIENQPPCFRDAPLPSTCIHLIWCFQPDTPPWTRTRSRMVVWAADDVSWHSEQPKSPTVNRGVHQALEKLRNQTWGQQERDGSKRSWHQDPLDSLPGTASILKEFPPFPWCLYLFLLRPGSMSFTRHA